MSVLALFPIPGQVILPNSLCPLHVFEPRYRKMISDCVANDIPLAVSHTKRPLKSSRVPESALANQNTFEPCSVFTGGKVQILQTFEDGRMTVMVDCSTRYRLLDVQQEIPYRLVRCEELKDEAFDFVEADGLKARLIARLCELFDSELQLREVLRTPEWQEKNAVDASFDLYQFFQLEPDYLQYALELPTPIQRLQLLDDILDRIS
ncbi:LON peptidase substrate-binding domain-containing protein [uncultured Umboniibacter sp.]|uniref:LON peptidase substrate-binding domain-containing protein n=1 Tax=uncultured Umboniibacter sp. TaxID=1798917 RepID=UPI0026185275|nr:LON peptidase substrate-binding domain-containing protein [uncultured Umboniibacter sp.]